MKYLIMADHPIVGRSLILAQSVQLAQSAQFYFLIFDFT